MAISITSVLVGLTGAAVLGAMAVRDHWRLRASRRGLLEPCRRILFGAEITLGGDDFPKIIGQYGGRRVQAELIPDTMTIRRLPQLWLSVTLMEKLPGIYGFAVLARPSGNDFYSLTESFEQSLTPPAGFPWEVLIRGEHVTAQAHLETLAPDLGAILADPCIKEVAVTAKGVRIVRQAAEGRRGEHLLLRQAIFDDAVVSAQEFLRCLGQLEFLAARVARLPHAEAV